MRFTNLLWSGNRFNESGHVSDNSVKVLLFMMPFHPFVISKMVFCAQTNPVRCLYKMPLQKFLFFSLKVLVFTQMVCQGIVDTTVGEMMNGRHH